jgi:F-type H+-transporting ATPase subunit epsilon
MVTTTLKFKMVTPVQTVFEQSVEGVSLPTRLGEITVLPEHTELVSILEPGELTVRAEGKTYPLAVSGGLVEVYDNTLYVLADAAEHATDIDLAAAEQRTKQLEQDLKTKADLDINSYAMLQKQLEHERARLQVGKKWKK